MLWEGSYNRMTLSNFQFARFMRDIGAPESPAPKTVVAQAWAGRAKVIAVEDCDGNAVLMVTLDDHFRIVQRWHDRADRYYSAYRSSWKAVAYAYAAATAALVAAMVGWLA